MSTNSVKRGSPDDGGPHKRPRPNDAHGCVQLESASASDGAPLDPDSALSLHHQQEAVLRQVISGENVFLTGSAGKRRLVSSVRDAHTFPGTGKTVVLRRALAELRVKYGPQHVAATALTGVAAFRLGGTTLHRWSGIGLGDAPVDTLHKSIVKNNNSRDAWMKARALVIDEGSFSVVTTARADPSRVSMLEGPLFDKLEQIARLIRSPTRPFGGIQVRSNSCTIHRASSLKEFARKLVV